MIRLRIFYEDKAAAGATKQFGPHILLCACVADLLGVPMSELKHLMQGEPKKGDGSLLAACKVHAQRGAPVPIFALFDGDQLRKLLKSRDDSVEALRTALEHRIASATIHPFVLEGNIDELVKAAAECFDPPVTRTIIKAHIERDRILNRAAYDGNRAVRECIRTRKPGFAALVDAVAKALS